MSRDVSTAVLRCLIYLSLGFVAAMFFAFRNQGWPWNSQLLEAAGAAAVLLVAAYVLHRRRLVGIDEHFIGVGLAIGLL